MLGKILAPLKLVANAPFISMGPRFNPLLQRGQGAIIILGQILCPVPLFCGTHGWVSAAFALVDSSSMEESPVAKGPSITGSLASLPAAPGAENILRWRGV